MTNTSPEPVRATLSNGLEVFLAPATHLHTTSLALFVRVGSRHESPEKNGISHFLEHMMFRGTERMPSAYALNLAVESVGGSMNGATQADSTFFQMTLPPESVHEGLALFGEMMRTPVFDAIDVEREIVCEEILEAIDEDGETTDIDDLSRELIFAPHALGLKITGDAKNVRGFSVQDLRAHQLAHYGASNMAFVATGAFDASTLLPHIERAFGALPRGTRTANTPFDVSHAQSRYKFFENSGSQAELRVSFLTFGLSDERRTALDALARIVDDGMSARLHRRLCDEQGLAYDIFAALDPYEDCGVFDFGASVDHAKVPRVVDEILSLIHELQTALVTAEELQKMQRRHAWDARVSLDDAEGYGEAIGFSALMGIPFSLASQQEAMQRVTAEDIRDVAREIFQPRRMNITVAGTMARAERDALLEIIRKQRA